MNTTLFVITLFLSPPHPTTRYKKTLFEVEQHIDNISRGLPSGPWRLVPINGPSMTWSIERIDLQVVGVVQQMKLEELI